jgi:hypothetical protein
MVPRWDDVAEFLHSVTKTMADRQYRDLRVESEVIQRRPLKGAANVRDCDREIHEVW